MDRPVEITALQEFNRNLIGKLQGYQLNLQIANQRASAAADDCNRAVSEASERVEAMRTIIDALIDSLRPYGLDRRKFTAAIQSVARTIPLDGPQAARHAVLWSESTRVLQRGKRG